MNPRTLPSSSRILALAAAACSLMAVHSANSAQLTFSLADPVPGAGDVANLTGSTTDGTNVRDGGTYDSGGANDAFTYVAFDRKNQGQTFTTGANVAGYTVSAIWLKHAGYSANTAQTYYRQPNGSVFKIRMTDPSKAGTAGFALDLETYTISGDEANKLPAALTNSLNGTGTWFKFVFDTPITLSANTLYGFDVTTASGNNFFEWAGTQSDSVANGNAYQGAVTGNATGSPDNVLTSLTGDRVFLVDLTPLDPVPVPVITTQPTDTYGFVGDNIAFVSGASADPAPTFQWQFSAGGVSWANISGATSSSYQINSVTYSANGFYRMRATNVNGTATSNEVFLDLTYPNPEITQQPLTTSAVAGTNLALSVTATGLGKLTYQWSHDFAEIPGATFATLNLAHVSSIDEGAYYVTITDDAAVAQGLSPTTTTSSTATVTLVDFMMTASATAPVTQASDRYFFASGINDSGNISGTDTETAATANDADTYMAFDRNSQGQTFTTGAVSGGYKLNAFTVQHVQVPTYLTNGTFYNLQNNDTLEVEVGTYSGGIKTPLVTGLAVYTGSAMVNPATPNNLGTGSYFTFDLSGKNVTLAPNTTYYFLIAAQAGDPFFELNGSRTGDYAGGTAIRGDTVATIGTAVTELTGDRVFHVALAAVGGASGYDTWIAGYPGVGAQTGFNADPDGDGIKNGLENFFGTNPGSSSSGVVQIAKAGSTLTFQHPQNANPAADVAASYRWSTDLVTFNPGGATAGGTTVSFAASLNTPVAGTTTVTATITGTIPAKVFVELQATRTP